MNNIYHLHGLRVSSEIPLDEPITESGDPPDVTVVRGEARDGSDPVPEGEVIAEMVMDDQRGYTVIDTGKQILIRFPDLADFVIDPATNRIICHPAPRTDPALAAILIPGTVLALFLTRAGRCVVHASAVEHLGQAVVFAGVSGMGKSTCAAMACAAGARLITDDALVVDFEPGVQAVPGTTYLRLRGPAAGILPSPPHRSWETADHRKAVVPRAYRRPSPIAGLVIPRPDRRSDRLRLVPVKGSEALPLLLAFARVPGWRRSETVRTQFHNMGTLAGRVPVYQAYIPWGPPFNSALVGDLVDSVVSGQPAVEPNSI